MGYGANMLLGLTAFIIGFAMFFVLPDMNITILGLDFTTMTDSNLWLFRLASITFAFFGLYFGATGGEA